MFAYFLIFSALGLAIAFLAWQNLCLIKAIRQREALMIQWSNEDAKAFWHAHYYSKDFSEPQRIENLRKREEALDRIDSILRVRVEDHAKELMKLGHWQIVYPTKVFDLPPMFPHESD